MKKRAELLRRRIAHYRRLLSEGADLRLASEYLRQIAADEAELAEIERATAKAAEGCLASTSDNHSRGSESRSI